MDKYPVISKNGNRYLVDVYEKYWTCGNYSWGADVFIKNPKPLNIFNRKKFIKVYEWRTYCNYDEWVYKYVETAIRAVEDYEKTIQDKIDRENFVKSEEEKWNLWDGVIK